jgi:integrase
MAGNTRKTSGIYRRGNIWWITYMDGEGVQHWESTGSKLKADADYKLACIKKDVAEGIQPAAPARKKFTTIFADHAVKYLEYCKAQKAYKTKAGRVATLCRTFGEMKLIDITLESLEMYQAQRQAEHKQPKKEGGAPGTLVKAATVNRELATLKNMFTKAEEWGLIPDTALRVARKVKLSKESNGRLRFLSAEEATALVDACYCELQDIVIFALNTGCRKSEILSLTWNNVDLTHGFITIVESKNGESREIPINNDLAGMFKGVVSRIGIKGKEVNEIPENASFDETVDGVIRRIVKRQGVSRAIPLKTTIEDKLKIVIKQSGSPYVFVNPETGTRFQDIKRSFATACGNAEILEFNFHDLRHTFASHLVMKGADMTTVSRLMGHKSLTMTLRYAHLAPNHLQKAVDMLTWT